MVSSWEHHEFSARISSARWLPWKDGRAQPPDDASTSPPFAAPTLDNTGESGTIPSGQSNIANQPLGSTPGSAR